MKALTCSLIVATLASQPVLGAEALSLVGTWTGQRDRMAKVEGRRGGLATEAIAFSIDLRVMIFDGRRSCRSNSITSLPAWNAASSFSVTVAGMPLLPIGEIPRNSITVDMVLAVNCPPQAPAPGQAAFSTARNC